MFELLYTKEAKKQINQLDKKLKVRFKQTLAKLASNPKLGKTLTAELKGKFSYRVGDYCVIYCIFYKDRKIVVLTIGHRREIYK